MAESYNTLAGLVQFNDKNLADLDISDLLDEAPLMEVLHAQVASNGTLHKYLKQTTASSSSFRAALDGISKTSSADTLITDTLAIMDGSFDTDVALADSYKGGRDAWLQLELVRTMKQLMFNLEQQVFYGVAAPGDSGGFPGLRDNAQLDALADTMVFNAGGTTAATQTSVYLIRSGMDDVSYILGNDGNIVVEDEPTIIQKAGSASGTFPALYVPVTGYSGFQIGGAFSAGRICNLHASDANSQLTDDMIYEALALFPSSKQPNIIAMNRQSLKQLRESRTAVNPTGAPAERPTAVDGIPIVVTDALVNTEAVEV
jgi:hypothetical protein